MATNPLDKVYLTEAQLETLASSGSITSGSDTYTADKDTLYLTDDVPACLIGSSAPTTSTEGSVGQFYLDTTTSKLYQCTAITSGTPDTYTWNSIGGGSGKYLHEIYGNIDNSGNSGFISFRYIDNDPTSLISQSESQTINSVLVTKLRSLGYSGGRYALGCTGRYDLQSTPPVNLKGCIYCIYGASNNNLYIKINKLVSTSETVTIDGASKTFITSVSLDSEERGITLNKNYITENVITL